MRLYEFSKNDAVQDLVILFRNQVKRADSENAFVNLNWNAISNLMRDMGSRIRSNYFDIPMILDYWGDERLNAEQ